MIKFNSNCTLPPDGVNFVVTPYVRGTLDILWSCLSILLICTWSIVHLNVPIQSTPQNRKQKYVRVITSKAAWMLLNVIAPEWPFGKAWSDYHSVSFVEASFMAFQDKDDVPWSRAHIYFANMGGFAIRFTSGTRLASRATEPSAAGCLVEGHSEVSEHLNAGAMAHANQGSPTSTTIGRARVVNEPEKRDHTTVKPPLDRSKSAPAPLSAISRSPSVLDDRLRIRQSSPMPGHELSTLKTPDVVDYSLGANGDRYLPNAIRKAFNAYDKIGAFAAPKIQKSMRRTSCQIGVVDWQLDATNSEAVAMASQIVELRHFQGSREKRRFVSAYKHWVHNIRSLQGDLWVLDANQLLLARELGILDKLPYLSEDDLGDRNKGDLFVKILALGQILWFSIQLGTRLGRHIPASQLEILTLAFAICTGLTYALLLNKPKDVQASIILPASRYATS